MTKLTKAIAILAVLGVTSCVYCCVKAEPQEQGCVEECCEEDECAAEKKECCSAETK